MKTGGLSWDFGVLTPRAQRKGQEVDLIKQELSGKDQEGAKGVWESTRVCGTVMAPRGNPQRLEQPWAERGRVSPGLQGGLPDPVPGKLGGSVSAPDYVSRRDVSVNSPTFPQPLSTLPYTSVFIHE